MARLLELVSTLSLVALFAAGCSDDCSRAADCKADEVCYKATCTPSSSPVLACNSDQDCNDAVNGTALQCYSARCRIRPNGNGPAPDAGPSDSGSPSDSGPPADSGPPPDTGTPPVDAGTPDMGTPDMGTPDMGIADTGPTDTGTVADGGDN